MVKCLDTMAKVHGSPLVEFKLAALWLPAQIVTPLFFIGVTLRGFNRNLTGTEIEPLHSTSINFPI